MRGRLPTHVYVYSQLGPIQMAVFLCRCPLVRVSIYAAFEYYDLSLNCCISFLSAFIICCSFCFVVIVALFNVSCVLLVPL